MGDDQPAAMQRIDAALARIDRATRAQRTALADLRRRHDALRERVAAAVAALDQLLAGSPD